MHDDDDHHDGESWSRAFYDIAQLLESAAGAEERVVRVLERLRALVPYECAAVLQSLPAGEVHVIVSPGTTPAEEAELTSTIVALRDRLVAEPGRVGDSPSGSGPHLAVPLIGLDGVLGVLYVRRVNGAYGEGHVRSLSVVAANLAQYLSLLDALAREAEQTRQLAIARATAEAADRAKDEFLALVSHELRTPLNSILAWTETLRVATTAEADRARAADGIERSVRSQAKLVTDLLDLACVAAATLRLDLRAVEPAKLIRAAIQTLQPEASRKSIRLDVALDETVPPLIADPRRLSQIVANLVANAIKFSTQGGRVEIRLEQSAGMARFTVVDDGSGISPELLSNVFEPFMQGDSSTTRAHGGMGLGLALVKDLVELHGGKVSAESPGETAGTRFTVELPLFRQEKQANSPRPARSVVASPVARALEGVRVLVVDDDRDIGEVLAFVLEAQGALVTVAFSAAEALDQLALSMPDVLLSDIAMPEVSGYDLMREVVAREGARAPPAAALTAYAAGQLERALGSGFKMLLEKPIDALALVSAVASLARATSQTVAS